ncbi:hypothetical protein MJO29_014111 [Puccinia striiformis f. sp. tritici]|nr:hypothetical protein MJO29_014111 [Puccinia striiformis f. sp. tritici]
MYAKQPPKGQQTGYLISVALKSWNSWLINKLTVLTVLSLDKYDPPDQTGQYEDWIDQTYCLDQRLISRVTDWVDPHYFASVALPMDHHPIGRTLFGVDHGYFDSNALLID